jgi:uncharacterized metal-binding protein YceD (DUF177 family)
MSNSIPLKRPGIEVGDRREYEASFDIEPFDLYGRHHEVESANARVAVTRLSEGLHLDLKVTATVQTTCDRTLEPVELELAVKDSEFLSGPHDEELCVADWVLDAAGYARRVLPNEVPMQVFRPDTEPVQTTKDEDEVDPRWRGLDDLFASGF